MQGRGMDAKEAANEGVEHILSEPENKACVACEAKNPTWACLPCGVLACTRCAGQFRDLGSGVCRVRSLLLDKLSREDMLLCTVGGNARFLAWFKKGTLGAAPAVQFFGGSKAAKYSAALEKEVANTEGSVLEVVRSREGERKAQGVRAPQSKPSPPLGFRRKVASRLFVREGDEEEAPQEARQEAEHEARQSAKTEPRKEAKKEEPQEISVPKKGLRKSGGPIVVERGGDTSRFGLAKPVEEERPADTSYTKSTGSASLAPTGSVVHGQGFSGSSRPHKDAKGVIGEAGSGLMGKVKKYATEGKKSLSSFVNNKMAKK